MRSTLRALAHEPLVGFVILGAGLFAADALLRAPDGPPEAPPPEAALVVPSGPIVVDAAGRAALVEHWSSTHPAPPTAAELDGLVQAFIDQEVLYREGLRRGLAEGDLRIRERVAGQMAYVLASSVVVPEPDDAALRAWFEAHADLYARPERVDLTLVFVEGDDEAAWARARALLGLLEGGADPSGLGDRFAGGRRLRGRRPVELAERFGDAFVQGLAEQAPGTWALRPSPLGLHLLRVDGWARGSALAFEAAREAVRHDWLEDQRARATAAARQELRARWEIVVSP